VNTDPHEQQHQQYRATTEFGVNKSFDDAGKPEKFVKVEEQMNKVYNMLNIQKYRIEKRFDPQSG